MANDNKNDKSVAEQADEAQRVHRAAEADKTAADAAKKAKEAKVATNPHEAIQKGIEDGIYSHEQLMGIKRDPSFGRSINNGEGQWGAGAPVIEVTDEHLAKAAKAGSVAHETKAEPVISKDTTTSTKSSSSKS